MRILLTNTTAYPTIGGVENSLRFIGRELIQAGHQVQIFCLQQSPDQPLRMEHEGMEIVRHPCQAERWPRARLNRTVAAAAEGVPAVLQSFRPDAVWSRSAAIGLGIRRSGYRGPLLQIFPTNAKMNCRGLYLHTRGLPWRRRLMLLALWPSAYLASARVERDLARNATTVAFSDNMRLQLLAGFPRDAQDCRVIPPGVDHEIFSPENGACYFEALHGDYGLSEGEPLVLYVGRLSTAKHVPMLMDAVATLKNPARLVLVGGGQDETYLSDYAAGIGIADRVIFAGPQHDALPGFYAMSRVSVLPTTIESFGQVYLESLACGTPAVGFAGDGKRVLTATSEILKDGENGGIARTVSAEALAAKIDEILSLDPASYTAMSSRAREDALERFSWGHFVERALALSQTKGGHAP